MEKGLGLRDSKRFPETFKDSPEFIERQRSERINWIHTAANRLRG